MAPRILPPETLTVAAFAPFGDVIEACDSGRHFAINGGNTERYHDLMQIEVAAGGHPIVSIFRGQPRSLPFAVTMLERHPLGSQSFMPLGGVPYLVVVAPPAAVPDEAAIRLFVAQPGQGVNYARGVWHHPLLALEAVSDFLVIDYAGPGPNCDEVQLAQPLLVTLQHDQALCA